MVTQETFKLIRNNFIIMNMNSSHYVSCHDRCNTSTCVFNLLCRIYTPVSLVGIDLPKHLSTGHWMVVAKCTQSVTEDARFSFSARRYITWVACDDVFHSCRYLLLECHSHPLLWLCLFICDMKTQSI